MRLYERWVVPALTDLAMQNSALDVYRREAIAQARGTVLEIGAGSGLNFALYGPEIERIVALDPSAGLVRRAAQRLAGAAAPVFLVRASAEALPFGAAAFDSVVTTWTLCSIARPAMALAEVRRVLKAGGRLVFVEHGLSPEPAVAGWQHRLTPAWRRLAGGCHLDRAMDELLRDAGFHPDSLKTGYMPGPKPWTYLYRGAARA